GVIISSDGYIITNNHVIEDANSISVTTYDGQTYDATLVGTDEKSDIAVIKINATGLTAATIGDSSKISVGDTAVVIGNPLGTLGGTVTNG
ncbi:MAG TPA: serine protease, partial [Erysipelotrichaceae bacterium]|nr:serine protease [Erysipelotrichaceae bacterium]